MRINVQNMGRWYGDGMRCYHFVLSFSAVVVVVVVLIFGQLKVCKN